MSSRALKLYFGGLGLALVLLGVFAYRPTPVVGVDDEALGRSIGRSVSGQSRRCESIDDRWICEISYPNGSSDSSDKAGYEVDVNGVGCWTARLILTPLEGAENIREEASGCITLYDL